MSEKWLQSLLRRTFLARLGAQSAFWARPPLGLPRRFHRPRQMHRGDLLATRRMTGTIRFLVSTASCLIARRPTAWLWLLRFANNYFTANENAYGLKDSDLAVVIVARHKSTSFGYTDAIWAKYGKQLSEQAEFTDPKTKEPPKINLYAAPADGSDQSGAMDALIKKGVHFAVCQMASRAIAGRIARATGGETDAILKEIGANLIPNAHFVPAGIVAVNRAQERGYSFALGI